MPNYAYTALKRTVDLTGALVLLAVAGPIGATSALLIKLEDGGPVFFAQDRVGLDGRVFRIYKFRSMVVDYQTTEQTYDTSPGVTRVGRILRRTKIDELPQLWNVARGDMSLIGPRPCLPATVEVMPAWALTRFDVRPGMTGLAQVSGSATLPWPTRWLYDVEYVERRSTIMDLRILLRTILTIIVGESRTARTFRA